MGPFLFGRTSSRRAFFLGSLWLLLLIACAFAPASLAQLPLGSIIGTVSEHHGGPLAGARVSVTSIRSGATSSVATDVNGQFTVEHLSPGAYRVTIAADRFVSHEEQVNVKPGHKSKLSASLKPTSK